MISCQGYPACRAALWLPATVLEASVDQQQCPQCAGNPNNIKMRVRPGSLRPFFQDEFTSCLGGCDAQLLEMLGVNKLNRQQGPGAAQAGGARGGGRFDPGPGRGGRGGRGDPGGPGGGGG